MIGDTTHNQLIAIRMHSCYSPESSVSLQVLSKEKFLARRIFMGEHRMVLSLVSHHYGAYMSLRRIQADKYDDDVEEGVQVLLFS